SRWHFLVTHRINGRVDLAAVLLSRMRKVAVNGACPSTLSRGAHISTAIIDNPRRIAGCLPPANPSTRLQPGAGPYDVTQDRHERDRSESALRRFHERCDRSARLH